RLASDASRRWRDGVLEALVPERALARQRPDGTIEIAAESEEGVERMRFVLGLDDDHSPFLRLCRSDRLLRETAWRLEGLRPLRVPMDAVAARLRRERGLGPWSVGVVCLEGLGRTERGLVGDLGLIKLLGALEQRRVEAEETAALLEPYGEWAGLASVYLLAGFGNGLIPLPDRSRLRPPPAQLRYAAA